MSLLVPSLLLLLVAQIAAQNGPTAWTASPFNAPALPLAVRSPYLNTWLQQGDNSASLNNLWPNLWTISAITGWYASVVVDGTAYRVLGDAGIANVSIANQTSVEFTPTRTSFLLTAGNMEINATFLSPIEPTDLVRQSLPFSYFYMTATSTDGNAHTLRMYSDISGEFIAGDTSQIAQWAPNVSGQYVVLQMALQSQQQYTEINNHAQDATEYYSFKKIDGTITSWAISGDVISRTNASNITLTLSNSADATPRAVQTNGAWPVLGIAVDWGSVSSTPEPAVWAIGVMRNPSVQYRTPSGTVQQRSPYFTSVYSDGISASTFFLDDFARALTTAEAFDAQLSAAGAAYSSDYADLLALSARQAMGALDITIALGNVSDVKVFMKNMGSAGSDAGGSTTLTSVNTVDVLYAAFPVFLYLNPELGGHLLAPLLEYQDSSAYQLSYAARNIGTAYPNATADGINDSHDYEIEETANMLIMTLAYSQASGNGTFLSTHYTLLRGWAEYLGNNTLTPRNQKSADFLPSSTLSNNNQTNVALKGIIGIAAMAKIAEYAHVSADQERFNNIATGYIQQWQDDALASDNSHVDFFYGTPDSNGIIYNLYADKLLQLNLVPDTVYDVLTSYYGNIATQNKYGVPLDNSDAQKSATNWMMFAASTVTNSATRDLLVSGVYDYASSNHNNTPFASVYDPTTGRSSTQAGAGPNSPSQGSMFALLALNTTIKPVSMPSSGSTIPGNASSSSSSKSNAGAIAGGVVGGIVGAGALVFGAFFYARRRRLRAFDTHADPLVMAQHLGKSPGIASGTTFAPFGDSGGGGGGGGGSSAQQQQEVPSTGYTTTSDAYVPGPESARTPVDGAAFARTPRPGESGASDTGLSASQVGSSTGTGSGSSSGPSSGRGRGGAAGRAGDGTSPQQVMLAKQTLVNEELRSEVDNLRRDLERIRHERVVDEEAPPSYSDPV